MREDERNHNYLQISLFQYGIRRRFYYHCVCLEVKLTEVEISHLLQVLHKNGCVIVMLLSGIEKNNGNGRNDEWYDGWSQNYH